MRLSRITCPRWLDRAASDILAWVRDLIEATNPHEKWCPLCELYTSFNHLLSWFFFWYAKIDRTIRNTIKFSSFIRHYLAFAQDSPAITLELVVVENSSRNKTSMPKAELIDKTICMRLEKNFVHRFMGMVWFARTIRYIWSTYCAS